MDFLTAINENLTTSRTHMDYLIRESSDYVPPIILNADVDSRRHFLNVTLSDESITKGCILEITETLSSTDEVEETFAKLSGWVANTTSKFNLDYEVRLTNALYSIMTLSEIDVVRRYEVVLDAITHPNVRFEGNNITSLLEKAATTFGVDGVRARRLNELFVIVKSEMENLKKKSNNHYVYIPHYNFFDNIISTTNDEKLILATLKRVCLDPASSSKGNVESATDFAFKALMQNPIYSFDLAVKALNIINWKFEQVWLLVNVHQPSGYRNKLSKEEIFEETQSKKVSTHLAQYTLDPENVIPAEARTPALIALFQNDQYDSKLDDFIVEGVQKGKEGTSKQNRYFGHSNGGYSNGGYRHLRSILVQKKIWRMFPLAYNVTQGGDWDEKSARGEIIKAIIKFPGEGVVKETATTEEAVALWKLVTEGKAVTATAEAQEALIKSGLLPVEIVELLATKKSRISIAARNQLGILEAQKQIKVVVIAWDADFDSSSSFDSYNEKAIENGLTTLAALASYSADVRMDNDNRDQARTLLISMLNHNPAYAKEVPDKTWVAFSRIRDAIGFSNELLNEMQGLSEVAQKLASKNLVKACLI